MSNQKDTLAATTRTLTSLPVEVQLEVINHLDFLDKQLLRATNTHFLNLLPQPTRNDLLRAEDAEPDVRSKMLMYCNPCNRLRRYYEFSRKMQLTNRKANKGGKYTRWCIDCGCRPLTGTSADISKYQKENTWEEIRSGGGVFVRCWICDQRGRLGGSTSTIYGLRKVCVNCHLAARPELHQSNTATMTLLANAGAQTHNS